MPKCQTKQMPRDLSSFPILELEETTRTPLRGWRLSSRTWNPITSLWIKQLAWLRIVHSGYRCLRLVLRTPSCVPEINEGHWFSKIPSVSEITHTPSVRLWQGHSSNKEKIHQKKAEHNTIDTGGFVFCHYFDSITGTLQCSCGLFMRSISQVYAIYLQQTTLTLTVFQSIITFVLDNFFLVTRYLIDIIS